MKPFRVDKLVGQARRWRVAELDDALEGLLELDAKVKGAPDAGRHRGAATAGVQPLDAGAGGAAGA